MAFCCQLLLPRTATSHYCCAATTASARGGGSGSSSSVGSGGGSGAILFLIVVVILLLFACTLLVGIVLSLFVARCSFRRPPLARFEHTMVGTGFHPSWSSLCCLGIYSGTNLRLRRLVPNFYGIFKLAGAQTQETEKLVIFWLQKNRKIWPKALPHYVLIFMCRH
jgi:hypothetical protein